MFAFFQRESSTPEKDFESICRSKLIQFLKNYETDSTTFNSDHISAVKKMKPSYFEKDAEKEDVSINWIENTVEITGLKCEVELCKQATEEELDRIVPRYN